MSRGRPHPRNARRTGRMRRDESSRRPTFRMLQSVFSAFHKLIPPPFCEFGHEPFVRSGDFVRAVRVIPNRLAHTGETLRANLMDPSKHLPQKEFGASTRTSFFFPARDQHHDSVLPEPAGPSLLRDALPPSVPDRQRPKAQPQPVVRLPHAHAPSRDLRRAALRTQPQRPHAHAGRHGPSAQGDQAA